MRYRVILTGLLLPVLSACNDSPVSNAPKGDDSSPETSVAGSYNDARNYVLEMRQGSTLQIDLGKIALPPDTNLRIEKLPQHGDLSIVKNGSTTYTLREAFSGEDRFTYSIAQQGKTQEYEVVIKVLPPTISELEVAPWKHNSQAAYSIIHDDLCTGPFTDQVAVNKLKERNLVAGFGAIVSNCNKDDFALMKKMESDGFEIVNHSWSHKNLTDSNTDLSVEVDKAHNTLIDHGFSVSYFALPYDAHNETVLGKLAAAPLNYLGARAGSRKAVSVRDMDVKDPFAPFRPGYDCYDLSEIKKGDPSCSKYYEDGRAPSKILNLYLDEAIANGGWGLRELHGVGTDSSWGWISTPEYAKHLDYVKSKVEDGQLWVANPSEVTRYWAARAYCGKPSKSGQGKFEFSSPINNPGCLKYKTDLDVIVSVPDADGIVARQDEKDLKVEKLRGERFLVSGVDPLGRSVTLLRK